jgi:hypothetical protein
MSKGTVTIAGIKHLTETMRTFMPPLEEAERADAYEACVQLRAVVREYMVSLIQDIPNE